MPTHTKAIFYAIDLHTAFEVQYNPKELKFDKPVSWKEHPVQGKPSTLEFQKVTPATLDIELHFDTTRDNKDVRLTWVNRLLELTNPLAKPTSGEAKELAKERPTVVWFFWGEFCFHGVVESVNVSYILFASAGFPLRAKVTVKMKEWTPKSNYQAHGVSRGYGNERLVQLAAGQTLSSLAAQLGTTAQRIGLANNIADLLDIEAGTLLVVPGREL